MCLARLCFVLSPALEASCMTIILCVEREERERAERAKREEELREYQERVKKLEEVERKKRQREQEIEERERRREEKRRLGEDPLSRKVSIEIWFGDAHWLSAGHVSSLISS